MVDLGFSELTTKHADLPLVDPQRDVWVLLGFHAVHAVLVVAAAGREAERHGQRHGREQPRTAPRRRPRPPHADDCPHPMPTAHLPPYTSPHYTCNVKRHIFKQIIKYVFLFYKRPIYTIERFCKILN